MKHLKSSYFWLSVAAWSTIGLIALVIIGVFIAIGWSFQELLKAIW